MATLVATSSQCRRVTYGVRENLVEWGTSSPVGTSSKLAELPLLTQSVAPARQKGRVTFLFATCAHWSQGPGAGLLSSHVLRSSCMGACSASQGVPTDGNAPERTSLFLLQFFQLVFCVLFRPLPKSLPWRSVGFNILRFLF